MLLQMAFAAFFLWLSTISLNACLYLSAASYLFSVDGPLGCYHVLAIVLSEFLFKEILLYNTIQTPNPHKTNIQLN